MTINVYAPAIRDAMKRRDLAEMKDMLRQAKKVRSEQGDLDGAIGRLQTAIAKLQPKKRR